MKNQQNQNQVQEFYNADFGKVRVIDIDGQAWFVGNDVAAILGYEKARNALAKHVDGDDALKWGVTDSLGRTQKTTVINESGLYCLIFSSKLPQAKSFKRWVTSEVLPSIRKHGAYATPSTLEDMYNNPLFTEGLIEALMEEYAKNAKLEKKIGNLAPKARYCDDILQCRDSVQVSIIAKDYGISAATFNRALHEFGIQYKIGGTWLLYQKYAGKGYTNSKTYYAPGGECVVHTCWTQKGRLFLYQELKRWGILPLIEKRAI